MVLGLIVSAVCLWIAVKDVEWAKIPPAFAAADYRTLPLIGLLLVAFFWTKAVRWAALLRPLPRDSSEPFRANAVLPATLIGFAGNNVLPAHAGEFFRVAVVVKRWKTPAAGVLSTVVLERVLDVGAILALFAASLPFVPGADEQYGGFVWIAAGCLAVAAVGCGVFLWKTDACVRLVERLLAAVPGLPEVVSAGVPRLLHQASTGLHALRSGRAVAGIAALSLLHWALMGGMIWLCLAAFGQRLPLAAGMVVNGVIAFGVLVPAAPGFFGVVQVCFRAGTAPFGVSAAAAFSASVYYQITQWVPITLAGTVCALRAGLWGGGASGQLRQQTGPQR
ncbi:lysylphosphatidylglycerol synthase transmembrane domain-containing protein [Alienimonas californiensis]|uniref:Flippase-like domain-containing protein n=1 Tax=Alienimonas californiensis TaxID=2527989 RepID=A0A517P3P7_9PLAN|nr:lysylphosphatidylglycerol synthase transmembrane domain-containing protein [Alienimonas californiensis]QDT13997.1 hypothetical protein CA12_00650 [Alienimonas californiensis]